MDTNELTTVITKLLHKLGIGPNIKGFFYIREAIILIYNDSTYLNNITGNLYPKIAEIYDSSVIRIERDIRHALEKAWNRGDCDLLDEIAGFATSDNTGKPTNKTFLSLVVDRLKFHESLGIDFFENI